MPDIITWVERIGLPGALLLGILYGLFRGSRWLGDRLFGKEGLLTGLILRASEFVDFLKATIKQQEDRADEQAGQLAAIERMHRDPHSAFSTVQTNRAIVHLAEALEAIARANGTDIRQQVAAIREALREGVLKGQNGPQIDGSFQGG